MSIESNVPLRVGALMESSFVNGPGNRFVIWVQGCDLGCPGCINFSFWPSSGGKLMRIRDIYELIISIPDIEGVTYSGGEPFQQAETLSHLTSLVSASGLTVMSYSGYTLEEIVGSGDPHAKKLLSMLDILVDGRFLKEQSAHLLWRGSRNQRVHFLSPRYREWETNLDRELQNVEVHADRGSLSLTGSLDWDMVRSLKEGLAQHGIILRHDKI